MEANVNIIIIDDELLVRTGVQGLIDWESHGYQLVGEARTGTEAIELIRRAAPVIVISDIMMPELTGLELLERVREEQLEAEFIFLTSHRDFQFAKRALELEALEYLLKQDLNPEQILSGVERAKRKLSGGARERYGNETISATRSHVLALHVHWISRVLRERHSFPLTQLTGVIRQIVSPERSLSLLHKEVPVLLYMLSGDAEIDASSGAKLLNRIVHQIRLTMNLDVRVNIFPFQPAPVERWLKLLDGSITNGPVWIREAGENDPQVPGSVDPPALPADTLEESEARLRSWFTDAGTARVSATALCRSAVEIIALLNTETLSQGKRAALGQLREEVSQSALLSRVEQCLKAALELFFRDRTRETRVPPDILSIQDYIKEHFAEPLSLKNIARLANKSPSYFSTYFHSHTGTSLVTYINRVRVDHACALLEQTDEPIKSVGFACGFTNEKYFSRIFKTTTGIPPGEYRSKNRIPQSLSDD